MADVEERRVGDLTIRIDRLICVGFGDCIDVSPNAFELDDEGIAVFLETADSITQSELIKACRSCPVDAFTVLGPEGNQLVP